MRRSIAAGTLLAGTALLVTACASSTSSTPPAAPATTPAAQSAAQASPPPASSSGGGGGIASPNVAGPPACATSGLQVKAGGSEGAAGSVYVTIDFTNSSGAT